MNSELQCVTVDGEDIELNHERTYLISALDQQTK